MPRRAYFRNSSEKAEAPKKQKKRKNTLKIILRVIFVLIALSFFGAVILFFYFAKDLPNPENLTSRRISESTKIYDRTGKILLYDVYGEERRTVVPLGKINDWVKKATIAVEDAEFYNHPGIDLRGIARAVFKDLFSRGSLQGGSTITQQLAKNSFLTPEKTLSRKIKELLLALLIEKRYSKDDILGLYLNQIPYGSNTYGIEAAANFYFNKKAADLNPAEAAYLAALPQAPSYYSPYGNHREELEKRKDYVLERMEKLGYLDEETLKKAREEKVEFMPNRSTITAPHFVMFVREELNEKYGEEYIETAGLKITTTLDFDLQKLAEKTVREGALDNDKKWNAKNAALVAEDPRTGQILAMVGSRDYWEESKPKGCSPGKNCQFEPNTNVALRERQPGSAFKPFVYAAAFKKGYTPETALFDLKTEFNAGCDPDGKPKIPGTKAEDCYHPSNYDDKFRGPVTMRQALAQSLNVPSVKTLYLAGRDETIDLSHAMGITTLNERNRYGLSLVLGGGEVKLIDMVSAYSVFSQEGIKNPPVAILKIEDPRGNVLEEYSKKPARILPVEIAQTINGILSDENARLPVFASHSPLYFEGRQVAVKTGTTQNYRDAWVVGYTPTLAAGVWVGNNDNTPMAKGGAGVMAAGPIWHTFLEKALDGENSGIFKKPEPVNPSKPVLAGNYIIENKIRVDKMTGKVADASTPDDQTEERSFPEIHSILYYISKNDPRGAVPQDPSRDPQFLNWETPILNWIKSLPNAVIYNQTIPQNLDVRYLPKIEILSPKNGETLDSPELAVDTAVKAPRGVKQVDFYLDDEYLGSKVQEPYSMTALLKKSLGSQYRLRAEVIDLESDKSSAEITIFR